MTKPKKKSSHPYSSEYRRAFYRKIYFEKLISTRVLEGLNFDDVEGKIAETLNISLSHARKIRKILIDDWHWLAVTPSKIVVTQTAWDEFSEKKE